MFQSARLLEKCFVCLLGALALSLSSTGLSAQLLRPLARCVEYTNAGGSDHKYIAHFDFVSDSTTEEFIANNTGDNFLTPVPATGPTGVNIFESGYHPDALKVAVPLSSGNESWILDGTLATVKPLQFGADQSAGQAAGVTPTCPATILAPPALTYSQPGVYTHQYLGQVDSGPGQSYSSSSNYHTSYVASVQAFAPAASGITFSNLQYIPNDTSNPSGSLNPNSIYGDVTVSAGLTATYSILLQLTVSGTLLTDGLISIQR